MTREMFAHSVMTMPDEIFKLFNDLYEALKLQNSVSINSSDEEAMEALLRIESRRKPSVMDIDYDEEIYKGIMEKYESID